MFPSLLEKTWKHYQLTKTVSRAICYRDDPEGNIIILSKFSFTKNQLEVLNKNLNLFQIKNFKWKIKLKAFSELKEGQTYLTSNQNHTIIPSTH